MIIEAKIFLIFPIIELGKEGDGERKRKERPFNGNLKLSWIESEKD